VTLLAKETQEKNYWSTYIDQSWIVQKQGLKYDIWRKKGIEAAMSWFIKKRGCNICMYIYDLNIYIYKSYSHVHKSYSHTINIYVYIHKFTHALLAEANQCLKIFSLFNLG